MKAGLVSLMHLVVTPGIALEVTLPGTPSSVPVARRLVREALPDCPRAEDLPSPRNGWGLTIVSGVTDQAAAVVQSDGKRVAWCEVTWSV